MKNVTFFSVLLFMLTAQNIQGGIPRTLGYQGVLSNQNGETVPDNDYNLTFKLYSNATDGTMLWSETQTVPVADGVFSVILGHINPLNIPFDNPYWLGITVGEGLELTPRIGLTSSAYCLNAKGVIGRSNVFPDSGNIGINTTSPTAKLHIGGTPGVDGIKFPDGTLQTTAATGGSAGWSLTGNSDIVDGTNFLGTTDNTALDFRANNKRVLRLEPNNNCPNIIGGASNNSTEANVIGATIGGGGTENDANRVIYSFGTIAGGMKNTAGGSTFIGGGDSNTATGPYCSISGGIGNSTGEGTCSTIGGGSHNIASGISATVPGGYLNAARGDNSFAAGSMAKANHKSSFVWADFTTFNPNDSTYTTGDNQFIIRAHGGVGIGTNNPNGSMLRVNGTIESMSGGIKFPDGTLQITASNGGTGVGHSLDAADGHPADVVFVDNAGNVGIGKTNPDQKLDVAGRIRSNSTYYPNRFIDIYSIEANFIQSTNDLNISSGGHLHFEPGSANNKIELYASKIAIGKQRNPVNTLDVEGSLAVGSSYSGTRTAPVNGLIIEGNVGIGTTSPQGKLDVNGTIFQRGGILHADYVFEPDYKLESIQEHAEFMWTNKHLKAIPKAAVDENGCEIVEYGSHQKGIVEELEKAHIYIEQLQECIKILEEKIEKLALKGE